MKKSIALMFVVLLFLPEIIAFCGFYVAKADTQLFNKSSEVIIARQGDKTVVTMSSDYQGEIKDFAMVVPVPEVLNEEDIKVVDQYVFEKLDTYSGPRLVEYFDRNPCSPMVQEVRATSSNWRPEADQVMAIDDEIMEKDLGVTIEAEYSIGEYEILILSAKESSGLETWLTQNDYKIPAGANEVLEPYIKSDMNFFVVKVNLEAFENSGFETLRPIQITYESGNFMLPIRLGMANANGDQDLIAYIFSDKGRVETTNYRTLKIPTDVNVPTFVKEKFGQFYVDLFNRTWGKNKNAVFQEYSWNLDADNYVKCDPCATTPPTFEELQDAGVFWVSPKYNNMGANYKGKVHLTRLHVRYNRQNFPQDLLFQETPDRENFQGRYVMQHPAGGSFDCPQGQEYLKGLVERMKGELETLASLTGSKSGEYAHYYEKYEEMIKGPEIEYRSPEEGKEDGGIQDKSGQPEEKPVDSAKNGHSSVNNNTVEYVAASPGSLETSNGFSASEPAGNSAGFSWMHLLFVAILSMSGYYFYRAFGKKKRALKV